MITPHTHTATIPLENLLRLKSHQKKDYRILEFKNCLEHVKGVDIYIYKLSNIIKNWKFNIISVEKIFEVIDQLIQKQSYSELNETLSRCSRLILRRKEITSISKMGICFSVNADKAFVKDILTMQGPFSIFLHIYGRVEKHLRNANQAKIILETAPQRFLKIQALQKEENFLKINEELLNEHLLFESFKLLREIYFAIENLIHTENKENLFTSLFNLTNLMNNELITLRNNIYSKIVIFLKSKYTPYLPEHSARKLEKEFNKWEKIFRSHLLILDKLVDHNHIRKHHDLKTSYEDLKSILLYSLESLSYQDPYSNVLHEKFINQIQSISLHANMISDISINNYSDRSFSNNANFNIRFLPKLSGLSVQDAIELLSQIRDHSLMKQSCTEKLHDLLLIDIEKIIHSQSLLEHDKENLFALKKWLIHSLLEKKADLSYKKLKKLLTEIHLSKQDLGALYLPNEIIEMINDACVTFSILLNQKELLSPNKQLTSRLHFKLEKNPQNTELNRIARALAENLTWKEKNIKSIAALLTSFKKILEDANETQKSQTIIKFNNLLKNDTLRISEQDTFFSIIQNPKSVRKLLTLPWIKNQSINKKLLLGFYRNITIFFHFCNNKHKFTIFQ